MKALSAILLILLSCGCHAATAAPAPPQLVRVMTLNMWGGGENGGQPLSRTAAMIRAAGADVVGLQEIQGKAVDGVRPDHARKLAEMLGWTCVAQNQDTAVITRFESRSSMPGKLGARLRTAGDAGREFLVFNVHFNHAPYPPYQLVGIPYAGGKFIKTESEAIAQAKAARGKEVEALVADIEASRTPGTPIFVTGDFNEPSHQDWTDAAVAAGLCPIKVAWPATRALAAIGLRDAYRVAHPDPVKAPGFTWTPITRAHDPKDRHERIDFVFACGACEVERAEVVGEDAANADIGFAPWPSDHRGVMTTTSVGP